MSHCPRVEELAIVSCLFAARPSARRRANLAAFRRQFFSRRLFIVELSFGDAMADEYTHLRFSKDEAYVMWQKERLLNLAIRSLPSEFRYVAWMDADVIFENVDWEQAVVQVLQKESVVQLFEKVVRLDQDGHRETTLPGIVADFRAGSRDITGQPGFAWAARRDVLDACGLLDIMIVGGADTYMAQGFFGRWYAPHLERLPLPCRTAVCEWGRKAREVSGGRIGCVPGSILHLYHGHPANRKYEERYEILRRANYNPETDLQIDKDGLYYWTPGKPELSIDVAAYLRGRMDDD